MAAERGPKSEDHVNAHRTSVAQPRCKNWIGLLSTWPGTAEARRFEDEARQAAIDQRLAEEARLRRELLEKLIEAKEQVQQAARSVKAYENAAIMVRIHMCGSLSSYSGLAMGQ